MILSKEEETVEQNYLSKSIESEKSEESEGEKTIGAF